jgi:deoxyribodipyrimidine photo-lyase
MKLKTLYWFKNDLRLHDNIALKKALENCSSIQFIYVKDNSGETAFDTLKQGKHRDRFIDQCLVDLHQQLQSLGSGLHVLQGDPVDVISDWCSHNTIEIVYSQAEQFPEETRLMNRLQSRLISNSIKWQTWGEKTLLSAQELPFDVIDLPNSFTQFRQQVESNWNVPSCVSWHNLFPVIGDLIPEYFPSKMKDYSHDIRSAVPFNGGESSGLERLNAYLFESHHLQNYKQTRNGLIGKDYSSKFSLWLGTGALSPRWIYQEIKKYESQFGANESTYWMVFELLWRDFFHFAMMQTGNRLFHFRGLRNDQPKPIHLNADKWEKWKNGNTGQPFVDANMSELKLTGFMSNRGRQNVASFWVHEYGQDWRFGAAHFEEQLIDYDPACNWGNWAYLAGVGHDPRGWRKFNIEKQALQYDPGDKYQDLWLTP